MAHHDRPPRGFRPPHHHGSFRPPRPSRGGGHHSYSSSRSSSNAGSALGSMLALGITALAAGSAIKKARDENPALRPKPKKRIISGATQFYLPRITNDFPEYHNPHAESDIKSVVRDYIYSIHSGKTSLDCEGVDRNAFDRIIPKDDGEVTDIIFHQIEIQNYQKSNNYATIFYQLAFGYLLNDIPMEVLYEVHYTLQSPYFDDNKAAVCSNCNAPIEIGGMVTRCKYCDAQISKSTSASWIVSDIREIR